MVDTSHLTGTNDILQDTVGLKEDMKKYIANETAEAKKK